MQEKTTIFTFSLYLVFSAHVNNEPGFDFTGRDL